MTGGNYFISVRDSNEMARTKETARRGQGGKAGAGGGAVLTKARPTMGGKAPTGGGGQQNNIGSDQGLLLYGR